MRWYQDPDTAEVTEEPCLCTDPKRPVAAIGGPVDAIFEKAAKSWEEAGRGPWIATPDKEKPQDEASLPGASKRSD